MVTGPLSSVWKEWVKWCIEFGIEANAIIAVPYDWRLPPSLLEERDLYFHKLKYVYFLVHSVFTTYDECSQVDFFLFAVTNLSFHLGYFLPTESKYV